MVDTTIRDLSSGAAIQDGDLFISRQGADTTDVSVTGTQIKTYAQSGLQPSGNYITDLTGDATATGPGSVAITLATVNANVGAFGSSTSIPSFTVNAKGLITAASGNAVVAPAGTLTGTTINATVVTSSLTSVGTLAGGATGAGFTVALGTSTLTGQVPLANGGTGANLVDPGADRIMFWDDSAGAVTWLEVGSGLDITGTVLTATGTGTGDVTSAANITDNSIVRGDGGAKGVQDSGVIIDDTDNVTGMASLTLTNTGLHLLDTNASHDLIIAPGSDLSADRTLTITTGDANRTLTLSGDFTGSGTATGTNTGDQTSVTGNAGTVTVVDAGGDTTTFVMLATDATGNLSPATDAGLTYNATTNALTSLSFIGALTGNASTATALQTPRTIGGVSFDGSANIVPTTIVVADTTDTTCFVGLWESATGDLLPKTDAGITYNANTGMLTATGLTGPLTGNASTATALQTPRTINGTSFDGTANITVTAAAGTLTGATLAAGVTASSLTSVGTLTGGATGAGFTVAFGSSTLTGQVPLANGGTAANLSDPGADRIMFWDDSAGVVTWLTPGTGITITGTQIDVSGGSTDSFKTIAVSGQSDVVADSATDTLTLVAGTNITITTNAGTDTITFNATGGGSGVSIGQAHMLSIGAVF